MRFASAIFMPSSSLVVHLLDFQTITLKNTLSVMSNMYGYTDYDGPVKISRDGKDAAAKQQESDDESSPLQVGFWMEGDSLAPPCGTSVSSIARMLEFAAVRSNDILYDLGCGDARVCLEAYARCHCQAVGVEIEEDLVERAEFLISKLPPSERIKLKVIQKDLRLVLEQLTESAKQGQGRTPTSIESTPDVLPLPTIVILYLLPDAIAEITPHLLSLLGLLPDLRILCNTWGIKGLQPVKTEQIQETSGAITPIFLYDWQSLDDI
jgi:SAM-dependent methyltransferase